MRFTGCLLTMLLPLASALAQDIPPQRPDLSAIRHEIQAHVARKSIPGLSIAVAQKGKILWEEGIGWADLEKRTRATANTPYSIASVTKTITATAIMQLQERGKLRLDTSVNDYLGPAKVHSPMWNASEATVRRVLSHTAGLTTFARGCLPGDSGCEMDEEIQHYGILFWPPGEVFDYSNLGYGILGEVVERTSGKSLSSYLQNELFDRLGMHHCGLTLSPSASRMAAAQYAESTHQRSPLRVSGHPGASALRCSAHDLLLFGRFHLKDNLSTSPLVSTATVDEMHRAQANTHGQYGLGWWIKEQSGYQILSAQGGTTDSYALLELVPSEDLAIVVIANSYAKAASDVADKILSVLLPDFAAKAEAAPREALPDSDRPAALAGRWSGLVVSYKGSIPISLEINGDGSVRGQVGEQPLSNLANVSLKRRHLYGQLPGDSAIADAPRHQHLLELDLFLRGDDLAGAATSRPLPGQDGDELPHWVQLTRAK